MRPLFIFALFMTGMFGLSSWYVQTANICPVPISYRLGDLDERFLITATEVQAVLAEAEAVWEDAVGRDLFVYDDASTFAVNFIYDERQQLARTEEEWRMNLDVKELESQAAIARVKAEGEVYKVLQAEYEALRLSYEMRLTAYNTKVASYNAQGGAPAEEFRALETEQAALEAELRTLTTKEGELNQKAAEINTLGEQGNALIEQYNGEVLQYNEVYGSRDLYTQGDYERDRINIYKFSDKTELTKVITHEFGHALGIGHVEGGESIMYYLMDKQPDTIAPTQEDIEALTLLCGDGTGFAHEVRRIIRTGLSFL